LGSMGIWWLPTAGGRVGVGLDRGCSTGWSTERSARAWRGVRSPAVRSSSKHQRQHSTPPAQPRPWPGHEEGHRPGFGGSAGRLTRPVATTRGRPTEAAPFFENRALTTEIYGRLRDEPALERGEPPAGEVDAMNHGQPAAGRETVPTSECALVDIKPQGKVAGAARSREQQVKRSPLPSAREIDAAIARKYGCEAYRES
jgi:hypothetical protein